jgi:hypothetical protein
LSSFSFSFIMLLSSSGYFCFLEILFKYSLTNTLEDVFCRFFLFYFFYYFFRIQIYSESVYPFIYFIFFFIPNHITKLIQTGSIVVYPFFYFYSNFPTIQLFSYFFFLFSFFIFFHFIFFFFFFFFLF